MNKYFWTAAGFILAQLALVYMLVSAMTEDLDDEIRQLDNRIDTLYRMIANIER